MKLRIKALVTTPGWKAGAISVVDDGDRIRTLIEKGRFELLEEVAAEAKRKPSPKVAEPPAEKAEPPAKSAE